MIEDNFRNILKQIPEGVELVVASKSRTVSEIEEVISCGAKIIGENYVKEAEEKFNAIGNRARWHLIGHLQKNKAKFAVKIFDMIETLDSMELASALDKECKKINKIMPVLIEVNSASEPQKAGVLPENVEGILKEVLKFSNLKPMGLMTMGPLLDEPEKIRPFFKKTRELFDKIKAIYGNSLEWKCLSMGMSDSFRIAIEEGANLVRVGTAIFGKRQ
ncbi:MAG: YggS family pyridoxal phosphate-dependent enzyme [Candidatus Omnitrophica bacterium]|nr:YggS family pyridoxal phosphate-dependent enzyme [Candidatus Omnitrophota bacterium]